MCHYVTNATLAFWVLSRRCLPCSSSYSYYSVWATSSFQSVQFTTFSCSYAFLSLYANLVSSFSLFINDFALYPRYDLFLSLLLSQFAIHVQHVKRYLSSSCFPISDRFHTLPPPLEGIFAIAHCQSSSVPCLWKSIPLLLRPNGSLRSFFAFISGSHLVSSCLILAFLFLIAFPPPSCSLFLIQSTATLILP